MFRLKSALLLSSLISLSFAPLDFAQPDENELAFEVNKIFPALSISRQEAVSAQRLSDVNRQFKPSWVKEYYSVEITTIHKGESRIAASKNDVLTAEQKDHLLTADAAEPISVSIDYLPENNLQKNMAKTMHFDFSVNPDNDALFLAGKTALYKYLKQEAIDKITMSHTLSKDLAAITFTINENGSVIDAHIFETSKQTAIDQILLEAICNMPNWSPAMYANGLKVKQAFALTVGNQESCVVNLLQTRKLPRN